MAGAVDWSVYIPTLTSVESVQSTDIAAYLSGIQFDLEPIPAPTLPVSNPYTHSGDCTRFDAPEYRKFQCEMPLYAHVAHNTVVYQNFDMVFLGQSKRHGLFVLPHTRGVWQIVQLWDAADNSHPLDNRAYLDVYAARLTAFEKFSVWQPGTVVLNPLASIVSYAGTTPNKRLKRI
jgi:hypothetical protein